jgi:DNA-binding MarR family transcriptional regulator
MARKQSAPSPESDQADLVHAQWARELPDVSLEGARILARAGRITRAAARRIDAVFARHGLDAGEFYVLSALRRAGAPYRLRPTEIFRALMISSGGLTDRLNRLERAGLVRRTGAEDDGRSLLVELTPEGRARVERAFREDMTLENELVAGLTAQERDDLVRLLRKLAIALERDA